MSPALEQIRARYLALEPRERRLVVGAAAVVLALLYYLLVWEPLALGRAQLSNQIQAEQSLAMELAAAAPLARSAGSANRSATANRNRSMLAVVDQTGKAAGLGSGIRRVQPEGDNRVRVWLEGVEFNQAVRWLHQIETQHGLEVDSADVGRQSKPGRVEARLGLVRP